MATPLCVVVDYFVGLFTVRKSYMAAFARACVFAFVLGGASLCAGEGPLVTPPVGSVRASSSTAGSADDHAAAETAGGLSYGALSADGAAASGTDSSSDAAQSDIPVAPVHEQRSDRFQWKPALAQYGLEISIQHAWRFVHENGTVDAVAYGPWFHDWIDSIGETRGWDDGDGWHASYVGHPLNGGIYGFIEQNNDPLYRKVEWGDGRIYWMSRIRAMAFAAVASTQWTLGPLSEASLGNVQLHASPGFIDLVNTPGLGVMEMMGEDMLDRYVIIPTTKCANNSCVITSKDSPALPSARTQPKSAPP